MTEKKKITPDKNPMPAQDPVERAGNFHEVALGYSEEAAVAEATAACSVKKNPADRAARWKWIYPPLSSWSPGRILKARQEAKRKCPAVCAGFTPGKPVRKILHSRQKYEPVAIGRIEYCADWELANGALPQETSSLTEEWRS